MIEAAAYSRLAAVYDRIVVDPCHERWAGYLDRLWDGGVRAVLDVCCGTGLMADALARRGYRVIGVDGSVAMLARARARLGPDAVLARQVLPALTVDGVFDAAVSTFDGLNYLTSADFALTMAALHPRLRPGGWLVFDLHGQAMMDLAIGNPVVTGEADGMRFVITSDVDAAARTCDTRIELTGSGRGGFSERHRQYFLTDAEVGSALADAGFEIVSVTDEYTDRPADATTLRATWAARRSGRAR